ncbi:MAG TPA: autotransporter-associated beta strand repeat-containing protein, partial [Verrucomicrobiae bacterium]
YSGSTANFGTPIGLGAGTITMVSNAVLYAAGGLGQNTGPTWSSLNNPIVIPAGNTATIYGPQRGVMQATITGGGTLNYITAYVRGSFNGNWSGFTGQILLSGSANGNNLGFSSTAGFNRILCTNLGAGGVYFYNLTTGRPTISIGELAGDSSGTLASTSSGNAGGTAANFAIGSLNTSAEYAGGIVDDLGVIKVGTGTLTLSGSTLTYSGTTAISNGVLALGASATLPNSTPINIQSPGVLDVTAAGTLTLANQTIQGNGTLNGALNTGAGTIVQPGGASAIGKLTVSGAVTLAGTNIFELNRTNAAATNDQLAAASVVAGGTLQVNNLGTDLHTGDTFKLFSVPVTGAFAVTNLPTTNATGTITYEWANNLSVDGTLQVLVGVPNVNTTPTNLVTSVTGGALTLSWPADHIGWRLLAQTNALGAGLQTATNAWVTVGNSAATNQMSFTIDPTKPTVFYRLVYP